MVPAKRLVRNFAEKAIGIFYEGPKPPLRVKVAVELFAQNCPDATHEAWRDFAITQAEECYRSGYVRGLESAERDKDVQPEHDPEIIARELDQDWGSEDQEGPPPIIGAETVSEDD